MQSNDYLSHYQNKKGIKACENMGRLSDNLFYAQEKSHKHWLLSLDNLGLRTARRGRIHNLGFRTAHERRIHNLGLRTACGRRIQKKHPRVSPKGPSPQTTKHGDRHKRTVPVCPPRVSQKDRPRVSPKRTVPVCPKGPSPCVLPVCPALVSQPFIMLKYFQQFQKEKGVQICSWWTLFLQMK